MDEDLITYEQYINNILITRGRFACGDEYHERHHIIPKSLGGSNDESNLIDLFAREHFEAHRLLAIENPDDWKIVNAWTMMAFVKDKNQDRYQLTAEEYEEAKRALSMAKKTLYEENPEKHPMYGKHHKEESKEKMRGPRPSMTGDNHPMYNKHPSDETRKKISKNHADVSGVNNPFYGRCMSEDQRKKISEAKKGNVVGKDNPRARKVAQYDSELNLIRIWDYIKQATIELGISNSNICSCCKGRLKSAGGFIWRYIEDDTEQNDYAGGTI